MALTAAQSDYLKSHTQGVLGTGRRNGSPQLSTINYMFDGEFVWISATKDRAKFVNAMRNPEVALLVPDNGKQVIVYGTAEGITERLERNRRTRALRAVGPNPSPASEEELDRQLESEGRVVIKITPLRAFDRI